jgi:putative CocE/NonD family hydrolase
MEALRAKDVFAVYSPRGLPAASQQSSARTLSVFCDRLVGRSETRGAATKMKHSSRISSRSSRILAHYFLATLCLAFLLAAQATAAQTYQVTVERNVPAKMRDGVILRADIYRPKAEGKFPVLLTRTPYDKQWQLEFALKAVPRGYVVIAQDTRGQFHSEDEWYPFKHESQDGYDTVEWAAALPYSNGKVGMFGASYVGATQFLAAIARPPHLSAISPNVTASNYHDGWTYQGGALEQWFDESWASGFAADSMERRVNDARDVVAWSKRLPLDAYPAIATPSAAGLIPYFLDWLAHPNFDDYWKQWSIQDHYADIQVPVFNQGAWYDIFQGGTLHNYIHLKTEAGNDAARRGQRLLVYTGGHAGGPQQQKVGAVEFGDKAPIDLDEATLRWYDWLLKGEANGVAQEKPVKIFVMGKNEWREEDDWPLARAKTTKYFLHSGGTANGVAGVGTLSLSTPAAEKPDQFVYDPGDPVPTIGGPLCCLPLPTGIGPQDQRPAESRNDVLIYSTPAFTKDTEVTGPVSLDLYVSTSAVDTDFTGKLVDLWPNGFAQNLTEGILRLRYRDSQEKPELANPGETYHITLDLWSTSNVFLAGHKLRLEVSSSNFPRFDRNLNTGKEQARTTRIVKATNVIYHDKGHPSALIVPVVP